MGFFPIGGEATSGENFNSIMSHEWLATSDKWGILPILSSYPSFNNIPDRKVETRIEQFSQNYRKFFKTVGKK